MKEFMVKEVESMMKKILVSLILAIAIFGFVKVGHATGAVPPVQATEQTVLAPEIAALYQIIKPDKTIYSSSERVVLINGKAPSGTEITINIFGTTDLTRRSFNLERLPSEQDYILLVTEAATSGNMGFFQKQLDLVRGINKIVIDFGVEGLDKSEFIVYTYDLRRTEVRPTYTRDSVFRTIPLIN